MDDRSGILEQKFDTIDESFFEGEEVSAIEKEAKEKADERQRQTAEFSFRQVGSIAQYVEPVSVSHPIEYVLNVFSENPDIEAVPVEEYDVVVGYIDRASLDNATKNALSKPMLKETERYVKRVPLVLYAKEYCEQCLNKVFSVTKEFSAAFFPVFHAHKSFFGLVSMEGLVNRISEVREQDLEMARQVQQGIMPDGATLAALPFTVRAWNRMANPIGGDLYTVYKISDTKYIVVCFDVSGKNVAAALVTVAVNSFFAGLQFFVNVGTSPQEIIVALDRFIEDSVPLGTFVTAGIFYVDMEARQLSVFNCGHTNIYFFVPGPLSGERRIIKMSEVAAFLPPLGIGAVAEALEGGEVKIPSCPIEKGLKAELYSDGLADMQTEDGLRYGSKRVKTLFKSLYSVSRNELSKKIEEAVSDWTERTLLSDDITVVDISF